MRTCCHACGWRSVGVALTLLSVLWWFPSDARAEAPAAGAADAPAYRVFDAFEGKLATDWKIIRPDPTHVSLQKNAGKLTITTQTGSIHKNETERNAKTPAKNLYLVPNPAPEAKDFVLTTCIESFAPTQYSQQAGLLVYDDDDNYFKWVIEGARRPRFNFLRETHQQSIIEMRPDVPETKRVWLRLVKRGELYERSYSVDGKEFLMVGEKAWGSGAPKWVGILAKNGSGGGADETDAAFDFFEARALTDAEANEPQAVQRGKLHGTWEVVACKISGKPITGAPLSQFTFDGNSVAIKEKTQTLQTEFTLDAAKEPKGIQLAALSSRAQNPASGVYSVEGDALKICLGLKPGAPVPTELETAEGDGRLLITLRRMSEVEVAAIRRNAQRRGPYFASLDKDKDEHVTLEELLADYPGPAVEQGRELFKLLDKNGDEKLSLDEFTTRPRGAPFLQMDLNADGSLSLKEFSAGSMKAASPGRAKQVFELIDRDGDDRMSLDEYLKRTMDAWFFKHDRNEDERLSYQEYEAGQPVLARLNRCRVVFEATDRDSDGSLSRDEFVNRPRKAIFLNLDRNGDEGLTFEEFTTFRRSPKQIEGAKKDFAKRDADGDGKLTLEEFDPPGSPPKGKAPGKKAPK